jgi:hypothetical protein
VVVLNVSLLSTWPFHLAPMPIARLWLLVSLFFLMRTWTFATVAQDCMCISIIDVLMICHICRLCVIMCILVFVTMIWLLCPLLSTSCQDVRHSSGYHLNLYWPNYAYACLSERLYFFYSFLYGILLITPWNGGSQFVCNKIFPAPLD